MMKILAGLYDRIITNRLKSWLTFNVDQTAFQKLKSTLMHIFTLRILIDVAIKRDLTLYIASVDIEKAFDHVPRSLLLKKLVKIGVGKLMLFALKQVYMFSIRAFQNASTFLYRLVLLDPGSSPWKRILWIFSDFLDNGKLVGNHYEIYIGNSLKHQRKSRQNKKKSSFVFKNKA